MYKWMNEWIYRTNGCVHELMYEWIKNIYINECMNEWMNKFERMNVWRNE